ncbi:MAG: hypothetical protein V4713_04625, partial [Pseudomonadota bacterium]
MSQKKCTAIKCVLALTLLSASPLLLAQVPGPSRPPSLPPGLYVQVLDGIIHLSNGGGTTNFSAGQFGYTPNFRQPPVLIPINPGM